MEAYYVEGCDIPVGFEDVSRRLGALIEEDEDREALEQMLAEAAQLAKPKAVYIKSDITEIGEDYIKIGDYIIESSLVREKLGSSEFTLVYTGTCGTELDEWSHKFDGDPVKQYFADVIKEQYLFKISIKMRKEATERFYTGMDMSSLPPGSLPQWPISGQKQVFAILGKHAGKIGVTLTDSCLMIPSKSMSGISFSADSHFESCSMCTRAHCQGRRAPYKARKAEAK